MTAPIRPEDVGARKASAIRPEIIDAANELIVEKWRGGYARVDLDDLCKKAREKIGDPAYKFADGELDIKDAFRAAGWRVDSPCYYGGDNYKAHFIFRRQR